MVRKNEKWRSFDGLLPKASANHPVQYDIVDNRVSRGQAEFTLNVCLEQRIQSWTMFMII